MNDPRQMIDGSPMSGLQIRAVILAIVLTALDGFDVLSISFASPGITKEWGIDRAALGVVLSAELIGMGIGSLLLGGLADRLGRRPTILWCLLFMTVGMVMVTTVHTISVLGLWRVVTGVGIGGMLASTNALAAEFSNFKQRHMCVSVMASGYPLGAIVGGTVSSYLLRDHTWRSVFYFGATVTALLLPIVYVSVPETLHWLMEKRPADALNRVNATLQRMGRKALSALPQIVEKRSKASYAQLFAPDLIRSTLLVALAYFFSVTTFYFTLKWVPQIVVDMGFAPSSAAGVLSWANVGGALGSFAFAFLTMRVPLKPLTMAAMLISTVTVVIFGHSPNDLHSLAMLCALVGFFTNAVMVAMYALFAQAFPTSVRASGTGFGIGFGRGGAVFSPIIAGLLFQSGMALPNVAIVMSMGTLLAAFALIGLKLGNGVAGQPTATTA